MMAWHDYLTRHRERFINAGGLFLSAHFFWKRPVSIQCNLRSVIKMKPFMAPMNF